MRSSLKSCVFGTVLILIMAARAIGADTTDANGPASDESPYLPWEKGDLDLGGYVAIFDSTVSFGLENEPGRNLNAEKLLGLDTTLTVFRAAAMFRPDGGRRHQVDLYYSGYHRSGEATLSAELPIDGVTYPVGAHVSTVFNFDIIRADYTYALYQSERLRIALGLGMFIVPLEYGLEITTGSGRTGVEGANVTLPLPSLALRAEFQVLPRLFLKAGVDGIYVQLSDFRGSLLDVNAGVEYRPWKHFGLGLAYGYTGVNVDATNSHNDYPGASFVGNVDVHLSGLLFYGKFSL